MKPELPPIQDKLARINSRSFAGIYIALLLSVQDKTQLTEEVLKNDLPAYYELLQFKCLLKLSKISSIEDFISGAFINDRDLKTYRSYFNEKKSKEATRKKYKEIKKSGGDDYTDVVLDLVPKTKKDVQYIINSYKKDIDAIDRFIPYAKANTNETSGKESREMIYNFLSMISMEIGKVIFLGDTPYILKDLIEKHGYPDVDTVEFRNLSKKL